MISVNQIELCKGNIVLFTKKNKLGRNIYFRAEPNGAKIVRSRKINRAEYMKLWRELQ